jgi:hypothetical protein
MKKFNKFIKNLWRDDKSWFAIPLFFGAIAYGSFTSGVPLIGTICLAIPVAAFVYLYFDREEHGHNN